MRPGAIYHEDLAYVHHTGFGQFASQAAPNLKKILKQRGIERGLIVDLGCGSGIWARELSRAGYQVAGIDISTAMIALAKSVAPRARFFCGSLGRAKLPRCDAVTAIGEAINYATGPPRLNLSNFFLKIAAVLPPGGMFIFDVLVAGGLLLNHRSWKAGKDWAVLVEAEEDRARQLLERRIITFRKWKGRYRRSEEIHKVQVFKTVEVESALRQAGFTVKTVNRYGAMKLLPRRRGFICRKT